MSVGDPSCDDWYNRRTGEIYIAVFKTGKSIFGTPYSFDLSKHPDINTAVDESLAPDYPEVDRKWLVGVGRKKHGLPLPIGMKRRARFRHMNKGRLIDTSVTPLDVRHAQVTRNHPEQSRRRPPPTATQIQEKIAGFFNRARDDNIGYLQ
jgi:hypothetical protein